MKRRRLLWSVVAAAVLAPALWWFGLGRPARYGTLLGVRASGDSVGVDARYEDVVLTTSSGRTLACRVRAPVAPSGERLPALLVAGGLHTGRRAVDYLGASFAGLAVACDYPWAEGLDRPWPLILLGFPRIRAQLVASPWALRVAASYVLSRPEADTARFAAVGASLGVPPVAAWAGRDTRPRAVALVYGGGHLRRQLEIMLAEEPPWSRVGRVLARVLAWLLADLEPADAVGGIAPRPLLVIGAPADRRVPRETVQALFDAAGEPKRLVWLGGEHMRPDDAAVLRAVTDSCLAWIEEVLPGAWRKTRRVDG